jgi:hypothetical protein
MIGFRSRSFIAVFSSARLTRVSRVSSGEFMTCSARATHEYPLGRTPSETGRSVYVRNPPKADVSVHSD